MKRQVLFVQGGGERVHEDWDSKLVESLRAALGPDYEVRYPRMPDEHAPSYASWKAALTREMAALEDGAILVGHSIGGTFLIHAIAEQPPHFKAGAIVLISAPYVGDGGWQAGEWTPQHALDSKLLVGVPIYLFHGLADDEVPAAHAELYARAIPEADLRLVPGRDHQFNNDLTDIAALITKLPNSV